MRSHRAGQILTAFGALLLVSTGTGPRSGTADTGRALTPPVAACVLTVPDVGDTRVVAPGGSVRATVTVLVRVPSEGQERSQVPADLLEFRWELGPAELGSAEPASGDLSLSEHGETGDGASRTWQGTFTFEYRAGLRSGVERLPLSIVNRARGPWGEGSEYPSCMAWEGVIPFVITSPSGGGPAEYLLHISGTYQGAGSSGVASWTGVFAASPDQTLSGEGVRVQVDRGSCFRASIREEFDIGGTIEDGRFRFRIAEGRTLQDDMELPQRLECLVNALKEAGSLLVDVAARLRFEEVTVPVPESGSRQTEWEGFTFRVDKL